MQDFDGVAVFDGDAGRVKSSARNLAYVQHFLLRLFHPLREINRKPVKDLRDFERLASQLTPKSSVLLLLNRGTAIFFCRSPGNVNTRND